MSFENWDRFMQETISELKSSHTQIKESKSERERLGIGKCYFTSIEQRKNHERSSNEARLNRD